ncbi:MAG TPA: hypothetical protein VL966_03445 [Alphaproteobacteria bacterium]|jgi:hypothetical protein|nr:hypothetical protein [Alphaproteobacteria bacterium]
MRALKLLVIGMGIAIVVATAVLVAIIVERAGKLGERGPREASTVRPTSTVSDAPIAVPPGFHVAATEISGDRVLVRLEGREPGAASDEIRLLIVDVDPSKPQRTVRLLLPESVR